MANSLKLWINAESGNLLASSTSFVVAQPSVFNVGDTVPIELHLVAGAGVAQTPYEVPFPAGATINVAIGQIGATPTSGQWRLSVDSTETADLAYNASAAAVQTALNALSAVSTAGGVTVAALGGGYSITWNTVGTKPAILAGSDTLAPASYEAIVILQAGDVSTREIVFASLRQNPIALTSTLSPIGSPGVSVSTVSAWNGSNKIIRVELSNSPKGGQWNLTIGSTSYAFKTTASAGDIRQSLGTACSDVSMSGVQSWDITLTSNASDSVNGSALIASDALVGTLSLATSEAIAFLGTATSASATLEVSSEYSGIQTTLAQASCYVDNTVVAPGAIEPVTAGTVLTEAVANARFVRKDTVDAPSTATQDVLWQNLGVTADGSDTVAAINASDAPASGNPFLTPSGAVALGFNYFDPADYYDKTATDTLLGSYLTTSAATSTYQTLSGMSAYETTSHASSTYQTISGMSSYLTTTSAASTYLTISTAASTYLTTSTAASTYALLSSFDQGVNTTDAPSFSGLTLTAALGTAAIYFQDSTTQDTRVVREQQANGSGFSTGGFNTSHYPYEVKVIDDTGTAYWVPARLA